MEANRQQHGGCATAQVAIVGPAVVHMYICNEDAPDVPASEACAVSWDVSTCCCVCCMSTARKHVQIIRSFSQAFLLQVRVPQPFHQLLLCV